MRVIAGLLLISSLCQGDRQTDSDTDKPGRQEGPGLEVCVAKAPLCRDLKTSEGCTDATECEWLEDQFEDVGLDSITFRGFCVKSEGRVDNTELFNCDDDEYRNSKEKCDLTKNCFWNNEFEDEDQPAMCERYNCDSMKTEGSCELFASQALGNIPCVWDKLESECNDPTQEDVDLDFEIDLDETRFDSDGECETFNSKKSCNGKFDDDTPDDLKQNCKWSELADCDKEVRCDDTFDSNACNQNGTGCSWNGEECVSTCCSFAGCFDYDKTKCSQKKGCFWQNGTQLNGKSEALCIDFRNKVIGEDSFRPDASICSAYSSSKDKCLLDPNLGCMWQAKKDGRDDPGVSRCRGPCNTQFADIKTDTIKNCVDLAFLTTDATEKADPGCRSPLTDTDDFTDTIDGLEEYFGDRDVKCFNAFEAKAWECEQVAAKTDCERDSNTECKWAVPAFECPFLPCGRGSPCSKTSSCKSHEAWLVQGDNGGNACCNQLTLYCRTDGEDDPACFQTSLVKFAKRYNCTAYRDANEDSTNSFCSLKDDEEECNDAELADMCTWQNDQCQNTKEIDIEIDSSLSSSPCFNSDVMFDAVACQKLAPHCQYIEMYSENGEGNGEGDGEVILDDDGEVAGDGYCTEADCWTQMNKIDCDSFSDKDGETTCSWDKDDKSCMMPEPTDQYKDDIDSINKEDQDMADATDDCWKKESKDDCENSDDCFYTVIAQDDMGGDEEPDCSMKSDEEECNDADTCTWQNGQCQNTDSDSDKGFCNLATCYAVNTETDCIGFSKDCKWVDNVMGDIEEPDGEEGDEAEEEGDGFCIDEKDDLVNGDPYEQPDAGEEFFENKCFGDKMDSDKTKCEEEGCFFLKEDGEDGFQMCTEKACFHLKDKTECEQADLNCSFSEASSPDSADSFCYKDQENTLVDSIEAEFDDESYRIMGVVCEVLDKDQCSNYGFCHFKKGVNPPCRTLDLYCNLAEAITCSDYINATLCTDDVRCDYEAGLCVELEMPNNKDDLCSGEGEKREFCNGKTYGDSYQAEDKDLSCREVYASVQEQFDEDEYAYFDAILSAKLRNAKKALKRGCCEIETICDTLVKTTTVTTSSSPTPSKTEVPNVQPTKPPNTSSPTKKGDTPRPTVAPSTSSPTTDAPVSSAPAKSPVTEKPSASARTKSPSTVKVTSPTVAPSSNQTSSSNGGSSDSSGTTAAIVIIVLLVAVGGFLWYRRQKSGGTRFTTLYENPTWGNSGRNTDLLNNDVY